jgi:hypothetical protein
MADNLSTFMSQLSRNLGASTSWNPQGLSRRVRGIALPLLYRNCRKVFIQTKHALAKDSIHRVATVL